ncbi:PfkB family carbohydrate kinase [Lutibacter sp. A64]|uniref:PfkB family carbohydrate kinase n=1 Tax=Lutibacter sp. A64 TaxID=2918526 RepID=UPI001F051D84|nr:PfkB family carbohydrate kinase [Lutibacter sp. A64]UMB53935.1 PfkB family carbohydrate kinase [Lutibacter sp. A64]
MINIIGGTYKEINIDANTYYIFGSGLRSVAFILENSEEEIVFYTIANKEAECHLNNYKKVYNKFNFEIKHSNDLLTFKYFYSLDNPEIYPNPNLLKNKPTINVSKDNLICFGMLDGNFQIDAKKVVYDPQTSLNPIRFNVNSKATELIYIVNSNEAKSISNCSEMNDIVNFFFDVEKVKALIIKNGPSGANLYLNKEEFHRIPAYKTENVSKIGSGDVFTTSFAYYWFKKNDLSLKECAKMASKATSIFCNTESLKTFTSETNPSKFDEFKSEALDSKQVYLAAPIFSLSDVILIDKIRSSFLGFGLKVFSPYHDVGYGDEQTIAEKDIKGLDDSDIVFSVLDGLDSGTLVELGYAMSKGKKIIGYHRTVNIDSLLMLKLANIKYYNDLTTSIYQTVWSL